jgi:hypothetical protein
MPKGAAFRQEASWRRPPKPLSLGHFRRARSAYWEVLDKYQTTKSSKALALLKKISPVAWQHMHFHGHHIFCSSRHPIDLDAGGQSYAARG